MKNMLQMAHEEQLKLKIEIRIATKMKKWADSKRSSTHSE
jgi:hypothetical protein